MRASLAIMRLFPARSWIVGFAAAAAFALATGLPTDIVPTGLYKRMTPVTWWDYAIWASSTLLVGLLATTYFPTRSATTRPRCSGRALGGGLLSFLAIGCPVCNKLVVALLGVGGALGYFAPVQPALGSAGLALLGAGAIVRLRSFARCPMVALATDGRRRDAS